MMSELPSYRRTTRYKSADGSRPRFLAIHEVDDMDTFYDAGGKALYTNWTTRTLDSAVSFDASLWQLFLERGDAAEKLGKPYAY